jgi:DNA-binding MarR family transcriptional regulator
LIVTINYVPTSPTTAPSTVAAVELAVTDLVRLLHRPRFTRRFMAEAGVSIEVGASWALARLDRIGPSRPSELASSLGVDASTITHRLKALEREGYVERVADPADGRAAIVRVSADGHAALEQIRAARRALFETLVADWPEADQRAFASMAERLTAALTEELAEP